MPRVEEQRVIQPGALPAGRMAFRRILLFSLPALTLGLAGGLFLPFQNLFFRLQFGLDDATVGLILAGGALASGVGALLGSPVAARLGLKHGAALLRFGSVGAMLLMLTPSLVLVLVGYLLRGLCVAASFPQVDVLAMRHTPIAQRGMIMSTMSVLWAGGWALAAVASGYVQIQWGFGPVVLAASVIYILSSLAILALPVPNEA